MYIQRTKTKNRKDSFKNLESSIRHNKLQWNVKCGSEQPIARRERLVQQRNIRKKDRSNSKKEKGSHNQELEVKARRQRIGRMEEKTKKVQSFFRWGIKE